MKQKRTIEIVNWQDVRNDVLKVNKALANEIDELDPPDTLRLVKANYLFGDLIVNQGILQLPSVCGELVAFNSADVKVGISSLLSYQHIPLFYSLQYGNEAFFDTGMRVIPLNYYHQGTLVGLRETLGSSVGLASRPGLSMSISAGSRSIFILPKISDSLGLQRLQYHYGLSQSITTQSIGDHWRLFKTMATSVDFEQSWHNTLLFFTTDWFGDGNKSVCTSRFKDYLLRMFYLHIWQNADEYDLKLHWRQFSEALAARNLKPVPYIIDQIRQIFAIVAAKSPAFKPVGDAQDAAPVTGLQQAFCHVYQLKHYVPTFMAITAMQEVFTSYVYYSLSFPTLLEGSPVKQSASTTILDLRHIKLLLETLNNYVQQHALAEHDLVAGAQLDYFHVAADPHHKICASVHIPEEDPVFMDNAKAYPDRSFCATSPFWRGCMRIKIKSGMGSRGNSINYEQN